MTSSYFSPTLARPIAIGLGLRGLIARTPPGFRVHVEAARLETLIVWLDGV